jgi:hypothetical protein
MIAIVEEKIISNINGIITNYTNKRITRTRKKKGSSVLSVGMRSSMALACVKYKISQ